MSFLGLIVRLDLLTLPFTLLPSISIIIIIIIIEQFDGFREGHSVGLYLLTCSSSFAGRMPVTVCDTDLLNNFSTYSIHSEAPLMYKVWFQVSILLVC